MLCPNCHAENSDGDLYCHLCQADLRVPSKSLVSVQNRLPTILHNPQVPRVAVSVGAIAVGIGFELLRRSILARTTQSPQLPQPINNTLPTLNRLREVLFPQNEKKYKLPKNYEIEETVVYMRRVLRRKS